MTFFRSIFFSIRFLIIDEPPIAVAFKLKISRNRKLRPTFKSLSRRHLLSPLALTLHEIQLSFTFGSSKNCLHEDPTYRRLAYWKKAA